MYRLDGVKAANEQQSAHFPLSKSRIESVEITKNPAHLNGGKKAMPFTLKLKQFKVNCSAEGKLWQTITFRLHCFEIDLCTYRSMWTGGKGCGSDD